MKKGKIYVIANWKMNPKTIGSAKKLFLSIKNAASKKRNVQTVICPPALFLSALRKLYVGHRIDFGAQNIYFGEKGSFTGEVSAEMVESVGGSYVIIGHSERRAMGETNELVNKKIISAFEQRLKVILCIGEKERDHHGDYLAFLKEELNIALEGVSKTSLKNILIAYEPIWAIGKTKEEAMKPQDVHETTLFLRKILAEKYDRKTAFAVPILYGGSVEPENCEALLREGDVSGFLIGHASLSAPEFTAILDTADAL